MPRHRSSAPLHTVADRRHARCRFDLAALVADVCALDSSSIAISVIDERLDDLNDQLVRAMDSSPDAETIEALDRAVQAAAKQLCTLGTRLTAAFPGGSAALLGRLQSQFSDACNIAAELCIFACDHDVRGAAQALYDCVTLPLECGRALLGIPTAAASQDSKTASVLLHSQTRLLQLLMAFTLGEPARAERFTALAPPEQLLPWLSAAVSKLLALYGTSLGSGCSLRLQVCLTTVINHIANDAVFRRHAAAVQRDGRLQRSVLQLLVPMLHASAAAMQLPANQRAANFDWTTTGKIVFTLTTPPLCFPFSEQLAATSADENSYAWHAIQSATELLTAMPASCPEGCMDASLSTLSCTLVTLLGNASVTFANSLGAHLGRAGASLPDAQRRSMLHQLQAALSQLPRALKLAVNRLLQVAAEHEQRQAAGQGNASFSGPAHSLLGSFGHIVRLWGRLISMELLANVRGSLAEVTVWCAAGSALLRSLPHAVALAAAAGSQQRSEFTLTGSLLMAAQSTTDLIQRICTSIADGTPVSAPDKAAAVEALWQLHTALCRCIHYSAAALMTGGPFDELLPAVGLCMDAAEVLSGKGCGTPHGSTASHCDDEIRHLLAMSVAQVEAALVAAAWQPALVDKRVAWPLLQALEIGPVALASSPSVQQALVRVFARNEAGEAPHAGVFDPAFLAALQQYQQLRIELDPDAALELAQVAATRSCAYLRCANLTGKGGPAARQGTGSQLCSRCRVAWYCGTACSHADWRAGHRRVCRALGAAKAAEQEIGV